MPAADRETCLLLMDGFFGEDFVDASVDCTGARHEKVTVMQTATNRVCMVESCYGFFLRADNPGGNAQFTLAGDNPSTV